MLLGAISLASTAATGYTLFFLFFLSSSRIVRPLGNGVEAASLLYLLLFAPKLPSDAWDALKPLLVPTLLVFTSAVTFLGWTYAYGGLDKPLLPPMTRFSHPLPGDNSIPYLILYSMMNLTHRIPHPLVVDWLSSDRPPLQTAIALAHYSPLLVPIKVGYQVLSVMLQCLWIVGLWLVLSALGVRRAAIGCVLTASLFTNFVIVQSVFVWPKLLATAYLLGFAALLFGRRMSAASPFAVTTTITAGALVSWAMLSHGGSVFALMGLIPTAYLFRRQVSWKKLASAVVLAGALYYPWTLYQKNYDPPGDRLVKLHLAGVFPIDKRTAAETIRDSYHALSRQQIIDYKVANLQVVFNTFDFWPALRDLLSGRTPAAARGMNSAQFFHFNSTVGLLLLGVPALLAGVLRRFRSTEWRAAILCWSFVVIANFLWCLIMFGPGETVVHQGTYATVILAFAGGVLGLWAVSKWLAWLVAVLQVGLFGWIHAFLLAPEGGVLHYACTALAFVGLVATGCLLQRASVAEMPEETSTTLSITSRV